MPEVCNPMLDAIDAISQEFLKCLLLETSLMEARLEKLIHVNHHLLTGLGVGHPRLDKIASIASAHECSAKLTGAGGGGCALIFVGDRDYKSLEAELLKNDFSLFKVTVGCEGVKRLS